MNHKGFFLFFVASVCLADRLSKVLVQRFLPEDHGFPVIEGVFHLTRVNNTGAAFGIFKERIGFLIAVTVAAVAVLLFYMRHLWNGFSMWERLGWSLVVAGALGNLYDRWVYGYVIDFLDFRVWPVFNLADSAVCVGVGLLFLNLFKEGLG